MVAARIICIFGIIILTCSGEIAFWVSNNTHKPESRFPFQEKALKTLSAICFTLACLLAIGLILTYTLGYH